jgi:hypothetical protein
MSKIVPLVVHIDGERVVVGNATVKSNGSVEAHFTSHEMADRLGFSEAEGSLSLGPIDLGSREPLAHTEACVIEEKK